MRASLQILATACAMLTGCVDEARMSSLERKASELSEATKKIEDLESRVSDIGFRQFVTSIANVAYLTPGSSGYSTVRFDLGALTVGIDDIEPFANGSKVILRFGNPLVAKVNGLKATIEWGEVDEKGSPKNETAKSKEVTFSEELRPGTWTRCRVVLEGIKAENLGFIRVRDVSHQGIALTKTW